jgi:hypothetical protein
VILFIIAAVLCLAVYFTLNADDDSKRIRKRDRFKPRKEAVNG